MAIEDYRILIVDDIPTNVALITAIISKLNAKYDKAESGKEALAKIDSFKPNIVLLDLMMPDIDGWEIIKSIRERYSKDEMIIIVTTAITDYENIADCYELGVNDYVSKPILSNRLLNTIQINANKLS